MVPRDQTIRLARARLLAERFPYSTEAVQFLCRLIPLPPSIEDTVRQYGPARLQDAETLAAFLHRLTGEPHLCSRVLISAESGIFVYCGICDATHPHARGACPGCGSKDVSFYASEAISHVQSQVCDACRSYIHVVDLRKDPAAIADLDELAALPVDLHLQDLGYGRLDPNLIGL